MGENELVWMDKINQKIEKYKEIKSGRKEKNEKKIWKNRRKLDNGSKLINEKYMERQGKEMQENI